MATLIARAQYLRRIATYKPGRYRNVLRLVYEGRCRHIVEVGTHAGARARQMIETAAIFSPLESIRYDGFDLFEHLTPAQLQSEFSRQPPSEGEVRDLLAATGADIHLHVGNTGETLPAFLEQARAENLSPDFIFIDGGHNVDTIASDWKALEPLVLAGSTCLFDDYYEDWPDKTVGCQSLVHGLDPASWEVKLLNPVDRFEKPPGILNVRMVSVRSQAFVDSPST